MEVPNRVGGLRFEPVDWVKSGPVQDQPPGESTWVFTENILTVFRLFHFFISEIITA